MKIELGEAEVYVVKDLSDGDAPFVDAFLRGDPLVNAYAIYDLHNLRHRTKIWVCFSDEKVVGLLLDYFGHTDIHFIWIWGNEKVADNLLRVPLPDKMIFHVPPELESVIRRKFSITAKYVVNFMLLHKGDEQLYLQHEVKPLNLKDALLPSEFKEGKTI